MVQPSQLSRILKKAPGKAKSTQTSNAQASHTSQKDAENGPLTGLYATEKFQTSLLPVRREVLSFEKQTICLFPFLSKKTS